MRAGRGFSLIELLIGAGLLGLFMTSIVAALYSCNNYLRIAEAKIDAQSQCLQATMAISRTLNESNLQATTVSSGLGICFASPRNPGTGEISFLAGQLVWKQTMAYYLTTDDADIPVLMQKGFPYPLERLDPEAPISVASAMVTASNHTRVIARSVKEFQVETYAPDHPSPELRNSARIVIETYVPHYNTEYSVRIRTQIRIEN